MKSLKFMALVITTILLFSTCKDTKHTHGDDVHQHNDGTEHSNHEPYQSKQKEFIVENDSIHSKTKQKHHKHTDEEAHSPSH